MKSHHLRWMTHRETALSKQDPLTEQNREESRSPDRQLGIDLAGHPANNPPMTSISFTTKTEKLSAQSAAREEMQSVTDDQKPASHEDPGRHQTQMLYHLLSICCRAQVQQIQGERGQDTHGLYSKRVGDQQIFCVKVGEQVFCVKVGQIALGIKKSSVSKWVRSDSTWAAPSRDLL